jgi:two-component system, OmpR family, sensor kinase
MRTPSLRYRVVLSGVAVFAVLMVVSGAFLYLSLGAQLEDSLDEVLAARLELARELATVYEPARVAEVLQERGVPATVIDPDGVIHAADPATPRFAVGPPGPLGDSANRVSRPTTLEDGTVVEVYATRTGVDATLRRVLGLLLTGTIATLVLAIWLFHWATTLAMQPLRHVVAAADRTAAGHTGERLRPDDPTTELGQLAVAYDRMLDSLEEALASARAAGERNRQFVDDAAHQLRTPLATIRGSVEALLRETDPAVRDRLMSNLVRETQRANELLTALLTLARVEQITMPEPTPTDLIALCRDELDRAHSLAPHLAVHCQPAEEPAGTWLLDEQGTREIVANLLDNARRHAAEHIHLEVAQVHAPGDVPMLEIRVRDDGGGVPPDAAELIFDRFAALDGRGGSGLGLPIARAIARAQGGEVLLRDGTFVVQLPAEPAPGPAEVTAQA